MAATNASFAAGQLLLIHQTRGTGAGAWELNRITSYTAGTITLTKALMNTYTDSGASQAQVRVMPQYKNVTINSGQTYTAKAWNGNVGGILAFFASGLVTVTGTITASSKGYLGGAKVTDAGTAAYQGEGTLGAGARSRVANGTGAGGGGPHPAAGGGGGHAAAGANGQNVDSKFGYGGEAGGNAGLTTLIFGGGGGGGNDSVSSNNGGPSGGIVLIIGRTVTITGAITTAGGDVAGLGSGTGSSGGSGSGGAVLIKTQVGTLGTTKITSLAGTVGNSFRDGGVGSVGRIHLDYKTSYTGTTNPALDARQDLTLNPVSSGFLALL